MILKKFCLFLFLIESTSFVPAPPRLEAIQAQILARTGGSEQIPNDQEGDSENGMELHCFTKSEIRPATVGRGLTSNKNTAKISLQLSIENVEKILDEMRPYLIKNKVNCKLSEINEQTVYLEMQKYSHDDISSIEAMKVVVEQRLLKIIPDIATIEFTKWHHNILTKEKIEKALESIGYLISTSPSSIRLMSLENKKCHQCITLKIEKAFGNSEDIQREIIRKLSNYFSSATLHVKFVDDALSIEKIIPC